MKEKDVVQAQLKARMALQGKTMTTEYGGDAAYIETVMFFRRYPVGEAQSDKNLENTVHGRVRHCGDEATAFAQDPKSFCREGILVVHMFQNGQHRDDIHGRIGQGDSGTGAAP